MIRSPLGLRLNSTASVRPQIQQAAALGAKGVVIDAIGDIAPDRLSETGRRDLRHVLRSTELTLIALSLPVRRPFDSVDQLEDRIRRADTAFALAYELGTRIVLARVGGIPPESDPARRATFLSALASLGQHADHRGIRLAVETGSDPGAHLRAVLDGINSVGLAVSIDPGTMLQHGHDPFAAVRDLSDWVVHAYANDASGSRTALFQPNPANYDFPVGVLDWEEYLGSLEEINYRGFLTIWPDPTRDTGSQYSALAGHLQRF